MKTVELSPINNAHSWRSSQSLLGKALRSPIEISISTVDHQLRSIWRPARLLFEQHRMLEAIGTLTEVIQQSDISANVRIPTLFLLAQMHTENGDSIRAEQCIQRGLRSLNQQTVSSGGWCDSARIGRSTTTIQHLTPPYSLGVRDWLTLSIQSLITGDLESSLRWIHQADRTLSCRVTSSARAREIGDRHAILACTMAQNRCFEEAESSLLAAYQQHIGAESYESASRDLILTSRLAAMQGQTKRAHDLLDAAECQLTVSLASDAAECCPLADIIHSVRYTELAVENL